MTASFRKIDYSLRPAKHAERKMICEIFRRVRPFNPIEDYTYVGFGSVWFADFVLFHRALGISSMLSIEKELDAQNRIEFNKPFRIDVTFKTAGEALHELKWDKPHLIWLDYDTPLSTDILADASIVSNNIQSGSIIAISVQCTKAPELIANEQDDVPDKPTAVQRFIQEFGNERVPQSISESNLRNWSYGQLSLKLVKNEIKAKLAARNTRTDDELEFIPICDIEYEDGAKMTTVIGAYCYKSEIHKFESCHFDKLDFYNNASKPIRINIPKLTSKEFKSLESQLPRNGMEIQLGSIPRSDADYFLSYYRYLPNFGILES